MSKSREPFDVPLTEAQHTALAVWLSHELDDALAARTASEREVEYWHALYEQARTRSSRNLPWPDAADLTSYIPCEKVDAIHARLMRTIWVNPLWTVEGWGKAADRAPFVEEFHQWKAEEERLQRVLDQLSLTALIEPRGLLEIYESTERRTNRKQIQAKPQTTPDGGIVFGEDGTPQLQMGQDGQFIEADGTEVAVTTVVDSSDVVRSGPQYRVLPYRDSLIFPGHARDKEEIWGYAKRIWPRLADLKRRAKAGLYDEEAVNKLPEVGDRESTEPLQRALQGVAPQYGAATVEKELWECLLLVDLNAIFEQHNAEAIPGKAFAAGARWYLLTFHQPSMTLLRIQHDDFENSRYVPFILFPRPDRATEGFSFVGHKLVTTAEEHTAYRNMAADRTSRSVNTAWLKLQGALWDEDEQPMGPGQVITVRDPREIQELQASDVPASVYQNIERCERTAERLAGVNDIASGQVAQESRTLGEIQMATEQSFVRMDLVIRRFQESMEDLFQVRHAIWKRVLAEQPQGVDAPESVLVGLEGRGVPIDRYLPDGKMTAALLDGAFRGKPYGSVETADPAKRRADLMQFVSVIPRVAQLWPTMAAQVLSPQAARAILRELLQAFRIQNRQAFLGSPAQDMAQQMALDQWPAPLAIPQMGGMLPGMGPPGVPPGMSAEMPVQPSGVPMAPQSPGVQ